MAISSARSRREGSQRARGERRRCHYIGLQRSERSRPQRAPTLLSVKRVRASAAPPRSASQASATYGRDASLHRRQQPADAVAVGVLLEGAGVEGRSPRRFGRPVGRRSVGAAGSGGDGGRRVRAGRPRLPAEPRRPPARRRSRRPGRRLPGTGRASRRAAPPGARNPPWTGSARVSPATRAEATASRRPRDWPGRPPAGSRSALLA